jgi:import inner membrane translocase subunit TIM44
LCIIPAFSQEEWAEEVRTHLAPDIIRAHLLGNTSALKPWLGEAVYNKLAADIRTRKHDGIKFDVNVLDIDENQMILKYMESGSPVIVVVYMVQQINCIRNRKDEIIEVSFCACFPRCFPPREDAWCMRLCVG